ncbi:MAG TPA: type II toxin-antitoxin system VapC family toxin [Beijerinckiaceae bacterium]|jgi:predicted nucleic acid-binding protein
MIVLDTNVISEVIKPPERRSRQVFEWLRAQPLHVVFTTTVTLGEMSAGVEVLNEGQRKIALRSAIDRIFAEVFAGRILVFDEPAARAYGLLVAERRRAGREMSAADAQIASIARSRGMTIATRDVGDFSASGVPIIDPWTLP